MTNLYLLIFALGASASPPNYQQCISSLALRQPYCNFSLSINDRVNSLIDQLDVNDLVNLITPDPSGYDNICDTTIVGVPSIGVGPYMWLTETNTGVGSACDFGDTCATTFPGPEGIAASFDRLLWSAKGYVLSTELRAMSNTGRVRQPSAPWQRLSIGVTGFGPNLNIMRDPRFGRASELVGEDPFLVGEYGRLFAAEFGEAANGRGAVYRKAVLLLKHYTAYSQETDRGHASFDIPPFDLWDTYLPAFAAASAVPSDGYTFAPAGVMCSYASMNGIPSCFNGQLADTLRTRWGREDAVIFSDCGAVELQVGAPLYADTNVTLSTWSINNGTDINAGDVTWRVGMAAAVAAGRVSRATVAAAARRAVKPLFEAGLFDPPSNNPWTQLGSSSIGGDHVSLMQRAATESLVLLRNLNDALPLSPRPGVVIVGPMALAQYSLLSDYYGDIVCPGGGFLCMPTIAASIHTMNAPYPVSTYPGVDVNTTNTTGMAAALAAVRGASVVVLAVGIDRTIEHESHDRTTLGLPGMQPVFVKAVLAAAASSSVPVITILVNGGPVSLELLAPPAGPYSPRIPALYQSRISNPPDVTFPSSYALIEAFNPAFGAASIASALYGVSVSFGRLPYTIYPSDWVDKSPISEHRLAADGGRTYRYYEGPADGVFGEGMTAFRASGNVHMVGCTMNGQAADGGVIELSQRALQQRQLTVGCTLVGTGGAGGAGAGAGVGASASAYTSTGARAQVDDHVIGGQDDRHHHHRVDEQEVQQQEVQQQVHRSSHSPFLPLRFASLAAQGSHALSVSSASSSSSSAASAAASPPPLAMPRSDASIITAYLRPTNPSLLSATFPIPLRTLLNFTRVGLPYGPMIVDTTGRLVEASMPPVPFSVDIDPSRLALTRGDGNRTIIPGDYFLDVWDGGMSNFVSFSLKLTD